jgi:hypothetical protein
MIKIENPGRVDPLMKFDEISFFDWWRHTGA